MSPREQSKPPLRGNTQRSLRRRTTDGSGNDLRRGSAHRPAPGDSLQRYDWLKSHAGPTHSPIVRRLLPAVSRMPRFATEHLLVSP